DAPTVAAATSCGAWTGAVPGVTACGNSGNILPPDGKAGVDGAPLRVPGARPPTSPAGTPAGSGDPPCGAAPAACSSTENSWGLPVPPALPPMASPPSSGPETSWPRGPRGFASGLGAGRGAASADPALSTAIALHHVEA